MNNFLWKVTFCATLWRIVFCVLPAIMMGLIFYTFHPLLGLFPFIFWLGFGYMITEPHPERGER